MAKRRYVGKYYRADMYHCIDHEQVKKPVQFSARTKESACAEFRRMTEADETIQEAQLIRVHDGALITDRVKYA